MAEFMVGIAIFPNKIEEKYQPILFEKQLKRVNLNPFHIKPVDNPATLKTEEKDLVGYVVEHQKDQITYFVEII